MLYNLGARSGWLGLASPPFPQIDCGRFRIFSSGVEFERAQHIRAARSINAVHSGSPAHIQ